MSEGDSHILIAGRSALPLLARRLADLKNARLVVLYEGAVTDRVAVPAGGAVWRVACEDDRPYALYETLRALHLPQDGAHVWLACGRQQAAMIRRQLVEDHGVAPHRIESPVMEMIRL